MTITEVFFSDDGQSVRLPQGFEFAASEIAIRRDGEAVILEPIAAQSWPAGFFEQIRIDDPLFTRPSQGEAPQLPPLDTE